MKNPNINPTTTQEQSSGNRAGSLFSTLIASGVVALSSALPLTAEAGLARQMPTDINFQQANQILENSSMKGTSVLLNQRDGIDFILYVTPNSVFEAPYRFFGQADVSPERGVFEENFAKVGKPNKTDSVGGTEIFISGYAMAIMEKNGLSYQGGKIMTHGKEISLIGLPNLPQIKIKGSEVRGMVLRDAVVVCSYDESNQLYVDVYSKDGEEITENNTLLAAKSCR
jgi:hypothetical protein